MGSLLLQHLVCEETLNFETVIVGHVSRDDMVRKLTQHVSNTTTHVFMDDGFYGEWKNHERAWRTANRTASSTHVLVLQDDALPVPDFEKHVQRAIEERPDDPISLYVGTHRPWKEQVVEAVEEANRTGASWISCHSLLWGVGLILPTWMIPEMLDGVQKSSLPYDQRISVWTQSSGREVFYTWPSLVDHADTATVAHGNTVQGIRVAHQVGEPNWTGGVVKIKSPWDSGAVLGSTRDKST